MTTTNNDISGGVVHDLPEDLRNTLASDAEARAAWEDLTPLCETTSNQKAACGKGAHGTQRGDAPTVLLVWLYSPHG